MITQDLVLVKRDAENGEYVLRYWPDPDHAFKWVTVKSKTAQSMVDYVWEYHSDQKVQWLLI